MKHRQHHSEQLQILGFPNVRFFLVSAGRRCHKSRNFLTMSTQPIFQVTVNPDSTELMVRSPAPPARTERFISEPVATFSAYSAVTEPTRYAGAARGMPDAAALRGNLANNKVQEYAEGLRQASDGPNSASGAGGTSSTPLVLNLPANKAELVFLDESPDYCAADPARQLGGTSGRECRSEAECADVCCGRGFDTRLEWKVEPCHCRFEWCCEVKCQQCERLVERRFCL